MAIEQSRDPKQFSAFELSGWDANTDHNKAAEGRQAGSYGKRPEDNPYDRETQPAQFGMWQIGLIKRTRVRLALTDIGDFCASVQ